MKTALSNLSCWGGCALRMLGLVVFLVSGLAITTQAKAANDCCPMMSADVSCPAMPDGACVGDCGHCRMFAPVAALRADDRKSVAQPHDAVWWVHVDEGLGQPDVPPPRSGKIRV